MSVVPYHRVIADPRVAGFSEEVAAQVFHRLNKVKNKDYTDFLQRELGEWYRDAPKGIRPNGPAAARTEHDESEQQALRAALA